MRLRVGFQILNLLVHALTLLGRAQTHSPVGVAQAQLGLPSTVGVSTDLIGFSARLILTKVDPLLLTWDLFLRMQVLLMKPVRTL